MGIIEVKNLIKKFKDTEAIKGASFCVNQGEIFAFLGPNGAGKTTSIRILTTLLNRTSGEVLVDGKDPEKDADGVRMLEASFCKRPASMMN